MRRKRIVLVMRYHVIEPLGVLYLAGLAKKLGWECRIVLVKGDDFDPLFRVVARFAPDLVGFSVWTGFHRQMFWAADKVRQMGIPVAVGGPHTDFNSEECLAHADYVVRSEGFRLFRKLLQGELVPGIHFDSVRMAEGFPQPDRALLYSAYPELGRSPIKSIMCSVGCPFKCSYCYAPHKNDLYGGFELTLRPVPEIIAEALEIQQRWPAKLVYFQDDIFGFRLDWLREFTEAWRAADLPPWHAQIRLEMTRDERRLDLFAEGGCTGLTCAIESGDAFLREFVLFRAMPDELIVEGVHRIHARGLALRTEQILAVPFSTLETDLATLDLNARLRPAMAWTSILAPYGGTNMGTIATRLGFWNKSNDELQDNFFDRTMLRHVRGGAEAIEEVVRSAKRSQTDNPLLRMETVPVADNAADIYFLDSGLVGLGGDPTRRPLAQLEYLSGPEGERYADQVSALQRLFDWFAKVPQGQDLASVWVKLPEEEWTWSRFGELTREHLLREVGPATVSAWEKSLADRFGTTPDAFPTGVAANPLFFCFLPSGEELARRLGDLQAWFLNGKPFWDLLGREVRYHLYERALYKVQPSTPPIASV